MSKIDYDLTRIEGFVFDIDGVLSPTTVPIDSDGLPQRMTNIRDGYALRRAVKDGFRIAVITGGVSDIVIKRYGTLGINDVYIGVKNKLPILEKWLHENGLQPENVAYMGDDIPDLRCMRYVGLPCAPYDASPEVLSTAYFISKYGGGYGCVRDLIEQVLRAQNLWPTQQEEI